MILRPYVSILVLMDLCIKTILIYTAHQYQDCFNPCFNGSMYKNRGNPGKSINS